MSRESSSQDALKLGSTAGSASIASDPVRAARLTLERVEPSRLAWAVLVVAMVAAAVLLYHLTRGTTFWFDEWLWIVGRRGNDVGAFLHTYNEHLSLVPIVIYRLLFAISGIGTYVPYRLAVIAGHLVCVLLIYVYAKRRVGEYLALIGALLILFLGPAWQDILWPFQIAWLIAIAAGIGAFLVLDRRDRLGDLAACVLLTVSLASTSLGVAIALGAAVDVGWSRRRWRDAWIVVIPLALYALWSLAYQHANIVVSDVYLVERFVAASAAASLGALFGLTGRPAGTYLTFGAPLALAALALLAWLICRRAWSGRAVSLATVLVAFWVLTAIGRAFAGAADSSRYLYVDCVFAVLLGAELGRGAVPSLRVGAVLALVAVAAVISNIGSLRDGGAYLRAAASQAKAELAALDVGRSFIGPDYVPTSFPGYPFIVLRAGQLFAAERSLGSPAFSPAQLIGAPEDARVRADAEVIRAERVALVPAPVRPAMGVAPKVILANAGATRPTASCVSYRARLAPPGQVAQLQVTVPSGGVWLVATGGDANVAVRRFADGFQPLGTLVSGAAASVRIRPDGATRPWHLQVITSSRATLCGLAG